jgi:hypothetical protein
VQWAYGQAKALYDPNAQPDQFLQFTWNQIVAKRQAGPDTTELKDAEYYIIGILAARGDTDAKIWAGLSPGYDALKLLTGITHLDQLLPRADPSHPPINSPGTPDVLAGLIDGNFDLFWRGIAQGADPHTPFPQQPPLQGLADGAPLLAAADTALQPTANASSAAAAVVMTAYERSTAVGTEDLAVGNIGFHIIYGPNIPQNSDAFIFDTISGSPLTVASGNHVIIESVPGQSIHAGSGRDIIGLHGGVNVVYPGMGSVVVFGGGPDALDYADITGSVTVDMSVGAAKKSNGGTDFFTGVHIVIGSRGNDAITCDSFGDVVNGGGDVISPAVGTAYTPAGAIGTNWTIIGAKDVNGDGKADYLWANAGKIALWTISNGVLTSAGLAGGAIGSDWTAKTTGDFNHDGFADVLWVKTGRVAVWELQGSAIIAGGVSNGQIGSNFSFKGLGDFNHDGNSDVLWQSNTGQVAIWLMQGSNIVAGGLTNAAIGTDWTMGGAGDFNGDGRDDALWFNSSGQAVTWLMNGTSVASAAVSGTIGAGFKVGGIADMNMDGKADVVWWNPANNAVAIWYMNGTLVAGSTMVSNGGQIGTDWKLSGVGDVTGDGVPDVVWTRPNGSSVIWNLRGNGDQLIGGAGRDTFQINTLSEMGEVISNFKPGAGQDVLDLHNLLTSIGHGATDAFVDGTVRLVQDGTAVEVQVDTSPGAHHYVRAATLQNVAASTLVPGNFQLSASAGSLGEIGPDEQFAAAGSTSQLAGAMAGISPDAAPSANSDAQVSQLVQAMAGVGGGSGAADVLTTSPLDAETSQQPLFSASQHA